MLYRRNYLIGIYGPLYDGEPLLALVDNIKEFAQLMRIEYSNAKVILNKLWNKHSNFIIYCGRRCTVEFIKEE